MEGETNNQGWDPNGQVVTLVRGEDGVFAMSAEDQAVCAAAPDVVGANGKWLALIKKLAEAAVKILPVILPLFLDDKPTPEPTPDPVV
jgi:hypothetical protein